MQLTDDEIRAILIQEKRRKRKKQRIKRRITLIILVVLILFIGIGVFINRDARVSARGIIFLDPVHGGIDSGSVVGDRYEKNDTLTLSTAVKTELESLGFKVYMSRTEDVDVDRDERGKLANEKNAQIMVSIHRNKAEEGSGVEVFIPSSNTEECQLLGNNIMKALVSQGFAERTVRAGTLTDPNDDYYENSVPTMPCCMVEVGFMQDSGDNKILDENGDAVASAIAQAIESTFAELYEADEEQ